jgi:hypothetical protein
MPRYPGRYRGGYDGNGCGYLIGLFVIPMAILWILANWDWIW